MTQLKHTPGPWGADLGVALDNGQHAVNADMAGGGPWRAIATVYVGRYGGGSKAVQPAEAEANARLIAAAPTMLDALLTIREARDRHAATGQLPDGYETIDDYAADVADAAIQKATA